MPRSAIEDSLAASICPVGRTQHSMIETLALALIGFSLCASLLLLAAHHSVYQSFDFGPLARASCAVMLLGLLLLQWLHARFLLHFDHVFPSWQYQALLFLVAPAFYLFFRGALQPREDDDPRGMLLYAGALPAAFLPGWLALPLAFALGTVFALLLLRLVLRLRDQRKRFRLEALAFAVHGAVALLVLLLGLASNWIGIEWYVIGYSTLIGVGFMASLYTLLRFPDLAENASEAVRSAYVNSSLKSLDVAALMARLEQLMVSERIYVDENLSLATLAEALGIGPHQLSELINSRLGIGFSRFVREHRVRAAQAMLIDEPRASVLSVGMSVGFTSQSNFYAAFREITGEVPGRFRRRAGLSTGD
jgi:AraC-like DNA-binding protein